jgi:hypothetical protein
MKSLVSIWKSLSFPVLILAIWLGWWGVKRWPAASAYATPITAAQLAEKTEGVWFVRDTFAFDLTSPGLRQENNYGIKGPAMAVFPVVPTVPGDTTVRPPRDTTPQRFGVVSEEHRFVGPAIRTFLRSDSMAITDIKVSTTDGRHAGNVGPELQALIQITADELGHAPLDLPNEGRTFVEGVALLKTQDEIPDLVNPAATVWQIRTGTPSSTSKVIGAFALALLLVVGFFLMNLVAKKFDREELEREMAEREEEQGLV